MPWSTCRTQPRALGTLDPANAAIYTANAPAYTAQLQEVDGWIQSQIDTIPADNRKLVTDHEAFGYYCEQYGLAQVGAVIPAYTTEAGGLGAGSGKPGRYHARPER
jgi:zinc/manganese transport system substrate-binding protein/manganese/iron transport system substrate-binding protein